MITAPYNFVPLNDRVFFPPWAEDVSHDIPFEDGESGVIDIEITAKSPIFIRDSKDETRFCNHNGEYYIPATSVKGMIRNVLEIMSFGKIKFDNKTHQKTMSVRDMTNSKELVGIANGCGFLKKDKDNNWIIVDYGKPRTIAYTNRQNKIIRNGNEEINCNFDTAKEKYEENGIYKQITIKLDVKNFTNRKGKTIGKKNIATISNRGERGYLILTGGIDGKKNEFVFADSDKQDNEIKNIDKAVKKFKQAYFESDSIDGNFWKNNWNQDIGIPIFYRKNGNKITDIGLTQLFKLAYNHTVNDATKQILEIVNIDDKEFYKLDLAEAIFGTTRKSLDEKENRALKGRVQFSHFKSNTEIEEYEEVYTVLGSPNPSFYPEYIEQNCGKDGKVHNEYNTLMKNGAKISGWKRYPLRFGKPKYITAEEGTDSATRFIPLGRYVDNRFEEFTFSGKLRFHNLKKVELGALISALTFHLNNDKFYHNIGMAKSLGFGKIKIDVDVKKYKDSVVAYELAMNKWTEEKLQKKWIETDQIKELFTMAYKELNIDDKLKYLKLDPDEKINEFVDKKKNKECLPKVSEMFDIGNDYPNSLLTQEILEQIKREEEEKKEQKLFDDKLSDVNDELQKGKECNIQIVENFINKYPDYEKLDEIKTKFQNIKDNLTQDKHSEVNKKFDSALKTLQSKKGNQKQYKKELDKFLKKWSAEKNNKKSPYILDKLKNLK
jgi:CRISPR-associated protein (TIGR03986 family)